MSPGSAARRAAGVPGRLAGAYRRLTRRERVDRLDRRVRLLEEAVAETRGVDRRLERDLRDLERAVLDVAGPGRPGPAG